MSSAPPPARLPRNVRLLGLASLLNDIGSEAVFPLLPSFISRLGGAVWQVGLIEGSAETLSSLLKLFSGAWSDRLGSRKGLVVGGYAVTALVRPLVALATSPWHVLAVRLTDRVGKGVRTAPRDALLVDSTPQELLGRAFGFHRAMDHLGAAIGPALAFVFLWCWPGEYRWLFALTLLPGLAVLALLAWGLGEPPGRSPLASARLTSPALLPRDFRRYLAVVVLFTLANSSDAFLLARAEQLGIPTTQLPVLWFVFHIAKSGGNLVGGGWVDRFGPRRVLTWGWVAYGLVYLAWGLAQSATQAWALMILYAGYYACAEPAEKALVAALVPAEQTGQAYGWFHLAVGTASLPASLVFGLAFDRWGAAVAFGSGGILAALSAALIAGLVHPDSTPATPPK